MTECVQIKRGCACPICAKWSTQQAAKIFNIQHARVGVEYQGWNTYQELLHGNGPTRLLYLRFALFRKTCTWDAVPKNGVLLCVNFLTLHHH